MKEHPTREAAVQLTAYLRSIGGASAVGKEDKAKVRTLMKTLGIQSNTGSYGVRTARVIMQQGLVPVVPYYWNDKRAEKIALSNLIREFAHTDGQRAAQWNSLLQDIERA